MPVFEMISACYIWLFTCEICEESRQNCLTLRCTELYDHRTVDGHHAVGDGQLEDILESSASIASRIDTASEAKAALQRSLQSNPFLKTATLLD